MKEFVLDNLVKSVLTPTIESNVPLLRPVWNITLAIEKEILKRGNC